MKFDPYEYTGVIVPGSVLVLTLALIFPDLVPSITSSLSLGDLGLVLILAFIAGHFVQAGGNLWETVVWKCLGGWPTESVMTPTSKLLNGQQKDRLREKLTTDFGDDTASAFGEGRGQMRELFVHVRQQGSIERIEKFNRNYGLMRGTAVAFLVASGLVVGFQPDKIEIAALLVVTSMVFTVRMVRFGKHYAREVFAEYLRTSAASKGD